MRTLALLLLITFTCAAQRVAVYPISKDTAKAIDARLTASGYDYFFLIDTNGNYLIPASWWLSEIESRPSAPDTIQFNQLKDGRPVPYKYTK